MSGHAAPCAPEPMDAADVLEAVTDMLATSGDERIEGVEACDGTPPYVLIRSRDGRRWRLTVHRQATR